MSCEIELFVDAVVQLMDHSEEKALMDLALYHGDPKKRIAAFEKISDPAQIAVIAEESVGANIRLRALEALPENGFEDVRLRIALKDIDERAALKAFEGISDLKSIAQIARSPTHQRIQVLAAIKISDAEQVVNLAQTTYDDAIFKLLLPFLNDSTLSELVFSDQPLPIRKMALSRIQSQKFLLSVVSEGKKPELRLAALSRLRDGEELTVILAKCALTDENTEVRAKATSKLKDQDVLIQVAKNDDEAHVRKVAVPLIQSQEVLGKIALADHDSTVRQAAATGLIDQEQVLKVFRASTDAAIRRILTTRIKDQETLIKILKTASDPEIRLAALNLIDEQSILEDVARSDQDSSIRDKAADLLLERFGFICFKCQGTGRGSDFHVFTPRGAMRTMYHPCKECRGKGRLAPVPRIDLTPFLMPNFHFPKLNLPSFNEKKKPWWKFW